MYKFQFILLGTLLLLYSCKKDVSIEEPLENKEETINTSNMVEGHVRLRVTEVFADNLENQADTNGVITTTSVKSSDAILSSVGVKYMVRTFPPAGRFEPRTRKAGLHLWYDVYFDAETPLTRAKMDLSDIEGIQEVEYRPQMVRISSKIIKEVDINSNITRKSESTDFDDPRLSDQWHYYNDGRTGVAGSDINIIPVWKNYTTGSSDVIVAIVDGGIDVNHEDLKDNLWVSADGAHGWDFVNNGREITPDDHGTHVAGTISAVNNNGKGVSGIAGGDFKKGEKGVRLMSCQIFIGDDSGDGAAAIKFGADNGAVISQNSWGYAEADIDTPSSDRAAIDYFIENAGLDEDGKQVGPMKGGIVIFAAGNDNSQTIGTAPAKYEPVLAVSSIGADYKRASYSNYGTWVDITAPGGDSDDGTKVLSTIAGGYGWMEGTSMACPHVSGVAALIVSHFGGVGFTPTKLKEKIIESARNIDEYNSAYSGKLGAGLINAYSCIAGASKIAPNPVTSFTEVVISNSVNLTWEIPSDTDDIKASGFTVYYSTTAFTSLLNRNNLPDYIKTATFATGDLDVGDSQTQKIKGLDFESTYYFAIDANDYSRNRSALSGIITLTTGINNPPIINPKDGVSIDVKAHATEYLTFEYLDADGHDLEWNIEPGSDAVTATSLIEGEIIIKIIGTGAPAGSYEAKIIVEDEYGLSVEQILKYSILPNTPPTLINEFEDLIISVINEDRTYDINSYFIDKDDEPLTYKVEMSIPGIAHIIENNNILYLSSLRFGSTEVKVTATDAVGESCSTSFKVLVRDENKEIDLYPNPVINKLNIRMGMDVDAIVSIVGSSGATVHSGSYSISPFAPAQIDMTQMSAGSYAVIVRYDDKEIIRNIVKL